MKLKKYSKYKDSGIEWIGEIPENWEIRRFKINFQYKKGKIPKELFEEKKDNNYYPYLSMDVLRGKEGSALFTTRKYGGIKVNYKDLLLLWDGSNAGEFVVGKEGFLSSTMVKFHLKDINKDYSYYLTNSFESVLRDLTIGMGIPHVNGNDLNNIKIPFVDIKIQKKISSFLDSKTSQIENLIEKDRKIIELLKERRVSLINKAVTKGLDDNIKMKDSGVEWIGEIPDNWEVRRINKFSYIRRGASPRPIDDPIYFDDNGDYSWVRISDVTASNRYLYKTDEKLSLLGKSCSVAIKPNEIFISIAGSVGKVIISKIKCCIHDGFVYFQNLKINSEYFYYIFITGIPYKGLGKLGTQLNLNTETIGNISVPYPSNEEQQEIVEFLDKETLKIDNHIKKVEERIEFYKEYKKSVIYNVVTGKIEV